MIIREIEVKTWEWGWCWGGADRSPCSRPAESRLLAVLATLQRFGGNFGSENFVAARILEASQGGAVAEGWSSGGEGESGGRVVGAPWHDALHGSLLITYAARLHYGIRASTTVPSTARGRKQLLRFRSCASRHQPVGRPRQRSRIERYRPHTKHLDGPSTCHM